MKRVKGLLPDFASAAYRSAGWPLAKSLAILAVSGLVLAACGGKGDDDGDDDSIDTPYTDCDGDAPSFVRQAMLSLDGRRPKSQAEVDVYVDLYNAATDAGADPVDTVARALMSRPEFTERWVDALMDALHVQRLDIQTEQTCWDAGLRSTVTPALAAAVRDNPATGSADGQSFKMIDLARSALLLDDLTPLYRGQLFSMVSHPIPAANVGRVDAELARREDFGSTFDASYIHRDVVCLGCHTSEASVTDSDDPALDRHWPVPGAPERAVYGDPNGIASERAHGAFRVDNFVDNGNTRPWGWANSCGSFRSPGSVGTDVAGVDTKLGSVTGQQTTVFDLEQALARGFDALRAGVPAPGETLSDPDAALAWLVTLKITEDVWHVATGGRLTIANYFPRNEASRDLLYSLASRFATSGYSLKALLVAIVASDFYNRQPAEAACGPNPYTYPAVFDPWTRSEPEAVRQGNGPGDAVRPVDARTLLGSLAAALEWTPPPAATRFPDYGEPGCENETCSDLQQDCTFNACCATLQAACRDGGLLPRDELPFLRGIGTFLRNSERGFAGLDFQARLAWEDRNGACGRPSWITEDFVDRLAAAGAADATATARDAVAALKDRLIGEPSIADGPETDALVAIVGPLDAPAGAVGADQLRRVCGALVETPQFLLQGIAGRGGDRPLLTPVDANYDAVCSQLVTAGTTVAGRAVICDGGTLALADAAMAKRRPPTYTPPRSTPLPPARGKPPVRAPAPTRWSDR